MKISLPSRLPAAFIGLCATLLAGHSALAGTLTIISPRPSATVSGAVSISAYANESTPAHLEVWDNGQKLGDYFSTSLNKSFSLAQGGHNTTVLAVANSGGVLNKSTVNYNVANQGGSSAIEISSPAPDATTINAVRIAATANENTPFHLVIWDNGYKLGQVNGSQVNGVYVLPDGAHVLTIQTVSNNNGALLNTSTVNYHVAENCSNSGSMQCNLDQLGVDNVQNDCNPALQTQWVANPCGPGVQGIGGENPQRTELQSINESTSQPNQGNLSLNGRSLHVLEVQGNKPSNVLFRGQSPVNINTVDSHWAMDEYVHLPNPAAHQAFEMDSQYSINGIWTKFYTECAFNMNSGTGYWAVFDTSTGGWIFLNGRSQGGQTPPVVPCNRSQFSQPWPGSGDPSFSGWHHIAWTFIRNGDGTVTFENLTFDGDTTPVNFTPHSSTGGHVDNNGQFSALIQLDGMENGSGQFGVVDAYISQLNLTHTP